MNYTFHFPDLGEGLEEGTILEWYVKEGDRVKGGDPLVQMETDKVVADIPSPKSGTIVARYGKVGDVIQVGAPLVEIDPEGASSPAKEGGEPQRKVLATPVARALAKEMGVDIHEVQGSGPSGRVKKEDILQFSTGREPEPVRTTAEKSSSEDVTYLPLTQIRKTIARNMLHAKHHAAHMSVFEEVEISSLKAVIAKYKPLYAERGVKLTYLSFLVKAVAQALKHFPQLNSQIDEENNRMIVRHRQHIAIAVDAPEGLVVPVIRDGDQLSVFHIAQQIGELVSKARARTLTLQELKEGSFS
ncbi:MAG: dihydrolipoamide acetyltransferase family protein, partial [Proteiniphilum sp.]|nr:dihydrolipoamide acetyltransferase family protein [Proteiniphilum sp.]